MIPKKDNPKNVSDYRPISLCNVCYKIIAKILSNRVKFVLPNLIGKEQSGFVQGRSPADNILTIQEVVHTLEQDISNPPRMIVKIDVEKAYDTLSWKAILATLSKMNFPTIWLAWIQACISSPGFAFLINGQPTNYIKSTRGVRQGDPLSSYLFILVSQNLTAILKYALNIGMIPGFDNRLQHNFNHLMYADDLLLITKASRTVARNIRFTFSLYSNLTGQKPNLNKSYVFFPKWLNQKLARGISNALGFKIGSFLFCI